jgi:hypothetical protein
VVCERTRERASERNKGKGADSELTPCCFQMVGEIGLHVWDVGEKEAKRGGECGVRENERASERTKQGEGSRFGTHKLLACGALSIRTNKYLLVMRGSIQIFCTQDPLQTNRFRHQ